MEKKSIVFGVITFLVVLSHSNVSGCPVECLCQGVGTQIRMNCSNNGWSELPSDVLELDIHWLDLSNNHFTEIPTRLREIASLEYLFMNDNLISGLTADALDGLLNLKSLQLKRNNITSWGSINPNTVLGPAVKLQYLYLNENPIHSFSSSSEETLLVSTSLTRLYLSKCKISKVVGQHVIQGLPSLEMLILDNNPIQVVPDLISDSLLSLGLSNTRLGQLQPTIFGNLPNLAIVDLSRNHRISLDSNARLVHSSSLRRISLSYCNMAEIELDGFENLLTVILKGNMIRQVTQQSFQKNFLLETIDISTNAITYVASDSFVNLPNLKTIDLSFNMIIRVERDTFKLNNVLTSINLSRNYISRFNKFYADALSDLNLSGCEIMHIDSDALAGFPAIINLDLSHNLMTAFPDSLQSETLETLDLSMCRITSIRNTTFMGFPNLATINLSGNRLTNPPRIDFFITNQYIHELYLGDNPWRCDCSDSDFSDFYIHFMNPFKIIIDREHTRCETPSNLYGQTWESACWMTWYPDNRMMSTAEKVWTFLMVAIIVFAGSVCIIMAIKRCIEGRRLTRQEQERQQNFEDYRQVRVENQMRMDQNALLNAPNPRETCPPCYEDAILLPRVEGSFASLDDLSTRNKNKTKDENDEVVTTRRCRCRSEEVLSMRESVRPDPGNRRSTKIMRNSHLQSISPPQNNNVTASPTNNRNTILPLPSPPPSPAVTVERPVASRGDDGSPYSKRRHSRVSSFRTDSAPSSPDGSRLSPLPPSSPPPPLPSRMVERNNSRNQADSETILIHDHPRQTQESDL